jgi:hypothetical protein
MCGRYAITLPPEAIRELFRTHGESPNAAVLQYRANYCTSELAGLTHVSYYIAARREWA